MRAPICGDSAALFLLHPGREAVAPQVKENMRRQTVVIQKSVEILRTGPWTPGKRFNTLGIPLSEVECGYV